MALGLDFAMPAMFLALLVPRLQDRVGVVVCIVAAVTALLGALYLPGKWYILLAGVVAVVTAFKTRYVLLTMGLGMAVMLTLRMAAL